MRLACNLFRIFGIVAVLSLPTPSTAEDAAPAAPRYVIPSVEELAIPPPAMQSPADSSTGQAICLMIESAARANGLPLEFFARVIWQESRFQSDAVGPMTRYGSRAQGIAQFMPGTAMERGLLDPFNPVQALPKSAEFLAQLRDQFGNLGLAAAAYNAGPHRVQDWLAGSGGMPAETRNYVFVITGSPIEDWAKAGKGGKMPESAPPTTCHDLMALLKRAPNPFVTELEEHVKLAAARTWGVQLAAGFDRNRALAMYARAIKNLSAVIGDRDPSILSSVQRSRGAHVFYQVRIGADTRPEADELCNRIRKAGGACFVLRNMFVRG
ncbi:MAG TPA: lytic transglycosylase domain-containing protein [Bradyrhizobium sp.]|uniref:lytic transglycosylase domain-containing protein n=1 Tax=Bradyrhizobium sp. TaxID=376 RepID=UPI002B620A8E|nr:lytic transglycosylase domain-containing protein [Bradyrhizobium sp.]HLZ06797.1 lytic transglycosylase domain-containing protein [Bradyrhizobium sp.]